MEESNNACCRRFRSLEAVNNNAPGDGRVGPGLGTAD